MDIARWRLFNKESCGTNMLGPASYGTSFTCCFGGVLLSTPNPAVFLLYIFEALGLPLILRA